MKICFVNISLLVAIILQFSCEDEFVNSPPRIVDQSFSIDENSANESLVGNVQSDDIDVGQNLSFSIIDGNIDNAFRIDNNGKLSVANELALDFEVFSSFTLLIRVSDDYEVSASSDAMITVDVNDVKITTSGLVAYFPLDGNANDESNNDNHGLVSGPTPVEDRNGNLAAAYNFDGTNDYIDLGNSNVFSLGEYDNFTVSFWVKPESDSNGSTTSIFSKYIAASDNRYYSFLYRPVNTFAFTIYDGGGTNLERSETAISNLDWHNVTWVYSEGTCEMFVNGVNVGTTEFTIPMVTGSTTANAVIGAFHQFTTQYSGNFEGSIDELRIYDRSLSMGEVTTMFKEPQ